MRVLVQGSGLTCLSQTLEDIFLMRGRLQQHEFTAHSDKTPSALVQKDVHSEGWVLHWGYWQSFTLIPSLLSLPGLSSRQYRNETAKSTEDKRIHSTHSSGTSRFAHRKYQPLVFVWIDNKYYLNTILSNIKIYQWLVTWQTCFAFLSSAQKLGCEKPITSQTLNIKKTSLILERNTECEVKPCNWD